LRKPFLKKDYTYDEEHDVHHPFLEVFVGTNESKKSIKALVDTGCTPCMSLCKAFIEKHEISFIQKMNKNPVSLGVADGHSINADYYKAICRINGKEKEIAVCVIDPEKFFTEEKREVSITIPLLGRGVLDEYDVLFEGKNKKFAFFNPE
jgi:predicted aspartyl protease